jgi:hypothetical protein
MFVNTSNYRLGQLGSWTEFMDLKLYKDTNSKCRLYWCLIDFTDCKIQSVMLVFSTGFVNNSPSYFFLWLALYRPLFLDNDILELHSTGISLIFLRQRYK